MGILSSKIYNLLISLLLLHVWQNFGLATTFLPVPLEDQIQKAYGVVRGEFLGKIYKKLSDDEVVTEASFKLLGFVGLKHNEIINKNNFKILYPGGKWQGVVYHVEGSPKFKIGEESIVLISRGKYGFRVQNLSLGKFNIIRTRNSFFLQSSVFSDHPSLGNISYDEFEKLIHERFGGFLENVSHDKFIYDHKGVNKKFKKKTGRSIASVKNEGEKGELEGEKEKPKGGVHIVWLIFILASLSSISSLLNSKRKN